MRKMCLLVSILLLISIMQAFAIDPKVDFYWEPTTPSAGELVHFYDNSTYSEYIVIGIGILEMAMGVSCKIQFMYTKSQAPT